MLPSDINLNIKSGTVRCNNILLVFDSGFSLWKNGKVNTFELVVSTPELSHKESRPTMTHKNLSQKRANSHEDKKLP